MVHNLSSAVSENKVQKVKKRKDEKIFFLCCAKKDRKIQNNRKINIKASLQTMPTIFLLDTSASLGQVATRNQTRKELVQLGTPRSDS
jgi:hypothetical protein